MVRTQIQLTDDQVSSLRRTAGLRGVSMAELIRMSLDTFIAREGATSRDAKVERARSVVGRFASGTGDTGREHDKYLTAAFGKQ
ncbi:MAG: CopG family transcriptional regulator [Bryobacteraceae bacterium]